MRLGWVYRQPSLAMTTLHTLHSSCCGAESPAGVQGPTHHRAFACASNNHLFSLHFDQLKLILWMLLGDAMWRVLY